MFNFMKKMLFPQKKTDGYSLYQIDGSNNHIVVIDKNGNERELNLQNETYSGLFCEIFGDNNTIKIHIPCNLQGTKIIIGKEKNRTNNSLVEICSSYLLTNNNFLLTDGSGQFLKIGGGTTMYGCNISLPENSKCSIGEDCQFASGSTIRCADGHAVYDINTGKILNQCSSEVTIGSHCWIGRGTTILKKAKIPNNSIVAECTVITKSFDEENTLIAGNPGIVKKTRNQLVPQISKLLFGKQY